MRSQAVAYPGDESMSGKPCTCPGGHDSHYMGCAYRIVRRFARPAMRYAHINITLDKWGQR